MKGLFLFLFLLLLIPFAFAESGGYCKISKDDKVGYWRLDNDGAGSLCGLLSALFGFRTEWIPDNEFGVNIAERQSDFCDGWQGNCAFDVSNEISGTGGTNGGSCRENWDCTEWSACSSGIQTRYCRDLNRCGTNHNKPEEEKSCEANKLPDYVDFSDTNEESSNEASNADNEVKNILDTWDYGAKVVGLIAVLVILIAVIITIFSR